MVVPMEWQLCLVNKIPHSPASAFCVWLVRIFLCQVLCCFAGVALIWHAMIFTMEGDKVL